MKEDKLIIGLAGKIGTGKSLISEHLKTKGFEVINVGEFFKELTHELFKTTERDKMEYLSKTMDSFFPNFAAWYMLARIYSTKSKKIVIDSIREPGEIEILRKFVNIKIICLHCEDEERIKRILKRRSEKDPKTEEEIKKMFKETPSEKDVEKIIEKGMFDFYIDTTNLTKEQVIELVEKFIEP